MDLDQKKLLDELLSTGIDETSFAKKLFFGVLDSKKIFPYPKQEPIDEYVDKVESFAKEKIDADLIDRQAEIPDEVINGLKELGVLGMTVPKEYGGLGMSQQAYCRVTETLARYCGSTTLFVNVHQSIGIRALLLYGTEDQKRKWLPALAKGEKIAAFALTEPNAGSDASAIETRADYDSEKKVYRINGMKQWITSGSIADVLTVMARTKEGISAFLVTPEMHGFHIKQPALEKLGFRGTKTAILEFKEMEVPEENLLGHLGKGLNVALSVLNYGRTTFGALCNGVGKYLVERAIHHAKTRYQFKRPLSSFPLVKAKLSRMAARSYAMDAATYTVAGLIDQGEKDIMLETAMLKVFASEELWSIIYDTMQIFGGRSFFTDEPFERLMRDARLNMIGEGSNEVMRAFISGVGIRDVGLYFKKVNDGLKRPFSNLRVMGNFIKQEAHDCIYLPKVPFKEADMKNEIQVLRKSIRAFSRLSKYLLIKHREGIVEKQLDLNRLTDALIQMFTTLCVLSKREGEIDSSARSIAKFYCQESLAAVKTSLSYVGDPFDKEIESLSDMLTQ
ncbi:MAG: acyl-CoA dehydrogenase family protein [Waddliaceae bacterium]